MYHDAITGPNKDKWIAAMYEELKGIQQNQTWRLVTLPPARKAIGVKWVLTCKHDAKGNFTKHKARLVAKGYSQEFGVDYDDHMHRLSELNIHLDAKNAFLHGESDFAIYIQQPPCFESRAHPDAVLLLKSLYGLK